MSFAEWKKRCNIATWIKDNDEAMSACQAAYKAGERQGRKDVEEVAIRAIGLRKLISSKPSDKTDTVKQFPAT